MANYYDVMQVCMNGHQITDSCTKKPQQKKDICPACNAKTTTTCLNCSTPIRGRISIPGVVSFERAAVPSKCHKCQRPYPWAVERTLPEEKPEPEKESALPAKPIEKASIAVPEIKIEVQDENPKDDITIENILNRLHTAVSYFDGALKIDNSTVTSLIMALMMGSVNGMKKEQVGKKHAIVSGDTVIVPMVAADDFDGKNLSKEINSDIEKFKASCKTLYCFVYDPLKRIPNPKDIVKKSGDFTVKVVIIPK